MRHITYMVHCVKYCQGLTFPRPRTFVRRESSDGAFHPAASCPDEDADWLPARAKWDSRREAKEGRDCGAAAFSFRGRGKRTVWKGHRFAE